MSLAPAFGKPSFIALALIVLFGCLVWSRPSVGSNATTEPKVAKDVQDFPRTLGIWNGTSMSVSQETREILETDDIQMMEYRIGASEEPPVWFSQVSGFGNRTAYHPPELCYIGSHFEVLEREEVPVFVNGQERRVMRLVISQDNNEYETWYWFTANGRITPSYYQQQWWLMMDSIHRNPMSGKLIRITTRLDDPSSTRRRLLAFVTSVDTISQHSVRHDI